MHKQNQGYGICGAKNVYSSKVKLDNWVEDNIGAKLAAQGPPSRSETYETVQSSVHINPSQMQTRQQPPLKIPTTHELKTKNKEGMSYSLLFEHGIKDEIPDERFTTTSMLTIMKPTPGFSNSYQHKTLQKSKSKQIINDINQSYIRTTEQRMASAHVDFTPKETTTLAVRSTCALPNFRRQGLLTSTFPKHN